MWWKMAKNNIVEISKELYETLAEVATKNILGNALCFRNTDDGVLCTRFDEKTSSVFFSLLLNEYSFRFPGEHITFSNIGVFLEGCKRQGFLKDPSFKMTRSHDKKGYDVLQITNSKSSMACKIYNPSAFPDDIGFLEELDIDEVDPEMFSFKMTSKQINEINEVCSNRFFECDLFNFIVKSDCVIMYFTGPKDIDYKIRIDKSEITGFDKIDIGEEIKFNYKCFLLMDHMAIDYVISVRNEDDNYNVFCMGETITGNQHMKSIITSPSKIQND